MNSPGMNNPGIVKQAIEHYRSGNYAQAKACYQQAAERYGQHLFASSIRLCELRQNPPAAPANTAPATRPLPTAKPAASPEAQLQETQTLLEHYYTRCQELEYQLLDRK